MIWLHHRFVGDPSIVSKRKYASLGYYVQYPLSTGHVHITSADDVCAAADFDPGFLRRWVFHFVPALHCPLTSDRVYKGRKTSSC